jgi:CBS domain-containing protein
VKVREVMSRDVLTVTGFTPLKEVARWRISGLPVVEEGRLLGVVTDRDILDKLEPDPGSEPRSLGRLVHWRRARDGRARRQAAIAAEVMSAPVVTIRPSALISEAARLMVEHDVKRLPVVDDARQFGQIDRGELCGIVTHADLMRAFVRPDREIAAEIKLLLEREWIVPGVVRYSVTDGAVILVGKVEQAMIAQTLAGDVNRIAGVTSVDSHLTWRQPETQRLEVPVAPR